MPGERLHLELGAQPEWWVTMRTSLTQERWSAVVDESAFVRDPEQWAPGTVEVKVLEGPIAGKVSRAFVGLDDGRMVVFGTEAFREPDESEQ